MARPVPDILGAAVDRQGQALFHVFRDQDPLIQLRAVPARRIDADLQLIDARSADAVSRDGKDRAVLRVRAPVFFKDVLPAGILREVNQADVVFRGVPVRDKGACETGTHLRQSRNVLRDGHAEVSVRSPHCQHKGIRAQAGFALPGFQRKGIYAALRAAPGPGMIIPAVVIMVFPVGIEIPDDVHRQAIRARRVAAEGDAFSGQDRIRGEGKDDVRKGTAFRRFHCKGHGGLGVFPAVGLYADGQVIVSGLQRKSRDADEARPRHVRIHDALTVEAAEIVVPLYVDHSPVFVNVFLRRDIHAQPFAAGDCAVYNGDLRRRQPAVLIQDADVDRVAVFAPVYVRFPAEAVPVKVFRHPHGFVRGDLRHQGQAPAFDAPIKGEFLRAAEVLPSSADQHARGGGAGGVDPDLHVLPALQGDILRAAVDQQLRVTARC